MLIAHLSDSHITAGALAAEPASGLARALGRVLILDPTPDCVVITGDLVDHGRPDEYEVLRQVLAGFPVPVHLVTGNHDDPAQLLAAFPEMAAARYTVDYPDATVVALDSRVAGTPAGTLGADQLSWLDGELSRRPDVPAFVCLHHPPVEVGIPFMDGIRLTDGAELAAVLARHRNVTRLLAGHLHGTVTTGFAGTVLTVAPSTYRQINLTSRPDLPGYAHEPTAFLLHRLAGDSCVTHSIQVSHAAAPVQGF